MNREHRCLMHSSPRCSDRAGEVVRALMNSSPLHRSKALLPRVPDPEPDSQLLPPKWVELSGQSLLDAVPDTILIASRAGEIVVANVQAEKLFGYQRDELIGRSVESLISPRLRTEYRQHLENLIDGQRTRPMGIGVRLFVLRKDATEVPVEIRFNSLTNEAGTFLVCAIRNHIDRRREERLKVLDAVLQETRESEERFGLLADATPTLIWMSNTDKLCIYVNKSWLNFTGRSMDSELGNGWVEMVHPEDSQSRGDTYALAFDRREEFRTEYRLRRYDGEYRWIRDFGVPRFDSDKDRSFLGYIGIGIDVTEQKLAEASLSTVSGRLIEAQEQERIRIARELHDDFSQNLALLCVDLEQLQKNLPWSAVEERARLVKMLKRTKAMSADIRSLSHELYSSRPDYIGLVPALTGLCKEIQEKYKITVKLGECGRPLEIPKDVALCLFRVAQEALGNVVKHSKAKNVRMELGFNLHGVSLRISDDGSGFNPNTTKPGAGLGLLGMSERLHLVGGRLSIKSDHLRGAEILAEVPLDSSANQGPAKALSTGGQS